ncbi:Peptidase M24, structural domain protein [Cordyceps fumosorosea ARSEF 2679]|uniref:Xaa-Pro aminopeptidase n=1 Tax=Cordyceps fumosorosea (strain ARSEF 2679) TaxID=1081104 RepID=A0A167LLB3_CORFA|nr:Peptidase M24, structural domain protein [Cordyceps fumosorosea ARSEF 2679]OAA53219.1 Peptidase M24, structural domain protein [Cordyceps fumosorosea ARSEF 2679]
MSLVAPPPPPLLLLLRPILPLTTAPLRLVRHGHILHRPSPPTTPFLRPAAAAHKILPPAPSHRRTLAHASSPTHLSPRHQLPHTPSSSSAMALPDFESVLKGKYPAKAHAKRVVQILREKGAVADGFIYLEARHTQMQEDNDGPVPFRQRRFFYYLTGCNLPDCFVVYDIQADKTTLFIPPIDPEDVIWSGLPTTIDDALKLYDVDDVKPNTELPATLAALAAASPKATVYAIDGQVSPHISLDAFVSKDLAAVKPAIELARVTKDAYEVALIRRANYVSGLGHVAAMKRAKSAKTEQELEASFLERCYSYNSKEMSYHPIFASGRAAATLHYIDNTCNLEGKQNVLVDAGAEADNYCADITRTFPISGKFTKESRAIYDIVLKMKNETSARLKGGVNYDELHVLAHTIAIDGLLELGILQGDRDEILAARTSAAFFPHGLGHHLGMDCHDTCGGQNRQDPDKLFPNLRLRGIVPTNSVVTIEPGVYFCEFIIKPYLKDPFHSKFINEEILNKYWDVGGVRIEDDILVTETGHENLTNLPTTAAEIEAIVASA